MRPSQLWAAAFVALGVTVAACSGGSTTSRGASAGSDPTTIAGQATAGSSSSATELSKAAAYAECIRSHGVSNWPDPEATPDGGYGFRTGGIDAQSPAFQSTLEACNSLYDWGGSTGQQLTAEQQQAWLVWAKCIRSHGAPDFADPTFSGSEVHIADEAHEPGRGLSPQVRSAIDACKSQMPSAGGLGG